MDERAIKLFQDFLNKAILQDQTYLVNTILKNDKQWQHYNEIHNRKEYRLTLSDGEFFGTDDLILEKQKELSLQLAKVNVQIVETNPEKKLGLLQKEKNVLENDLQLLEEAQSRNRYIYQWLLVPHWLGDELIDWGEVVFRSFGCNFWGVSHSQEDFNSKEAILLDIFEEIHI